MAAVAVARPLAPISHDFNLLKTKLNKKATFEEACLECIQYISEDPEYAANDAFRQLLRRALTVAHSRFASTDTALWQAGLKLVRAAASSEYAAKDPVFAQELSSYEQQCLEILQEDAEQASIRGPNTTHRSLFEGQLSGAEQAARAAAPHAALQDLAALLLGQQMTTATTPEDGDVQQQQQQGANERGNGQQAPQELSPEIAEALQRELDSIAVQIMEETAASVPRAPPPASKAVLRTLPRCKVTAEKLKELGGDDARCPVCFCLEEGDEIMTLPCQHWAHPDCLDPWLKGTNTCPTCRHELQTEDSEYERRKERAKIEAEERKGAENALSHNEFLYI